METIKKLIESSAIKLVLSDPQDLQGLASVHTCFEQIAECARKVDTGSSENMELIGNASGKAADLIQEIILQGVDDAEEALSAGDSVRNILAQK